VGAKKIQRTLSPRVKQCALQAKKVWRTRNNITVCALIITLAPVPLQRKRFSNKNVGKQCPT